MAISLTKDGFNLNGNNPNSTPLVYGASTTGSGGTYLCISKSTGEDSNLKTIYGFSYNSGSSGSGDFNIRMA